MSDFSLPNIADYDYPLPQNRIAYQPLPRGESKLLVYQNGQALESRYADIAAHLPERSWLIFNQTKVIQARLYFPWRRDKLIEIFCLQPATAMSLEQAMQQKNSLRYRCLVGGGRKWKSETLKLSLGDFELCAQRLGRLDNDFLVELSWDSELNFGEVLDRAGAMPLPPYIKRAAEDSDRQNYQTVYARRQGSVAAPTAGLHFNKAIFESLTSAGHQHSFLTLHVGAGTFKPVDSSVKKHQMHAEEFYVERSFVEEVLQNLGESRALVPVGTTSMRALESMYWLGCMAAAGALLPQGEWLVPQWVGFDKKYPALEAGDAFAALAALLRENSLSGKLAKTALMIAPGYQHRLIKALVTNFHQPKSTLLLLVSSLIGEDWRKLYRHALSRDFRFLSYGDGCLLKL